MNYFSSLLVGVTVELQVAVDVDDAEGAKVGMVDSRDVVGVFVSAPCSPS
jgi:hypothetical protein